VEKGFRTQARRVLLGQVAPVYHRASGVQKQQIFEEFVSATGYARKYALWLLNHSEEVCAPPAALRRRYGLEVEEALVLAWKTLNRICTKRLMPFLPSIIETLEQHGHVQLSTEVRSQLLSMSAATADRFLQALHPSPRPFDHQSRSLAQTADPDPHLRKVGTRPNQASWKSIWSPIVEGECRVVASTPSR